MPWCPTTGFTNTVMSLPLKGIIFSPPFSLVVGVSIPLPPLLFSLFSPLRSTFVCCTHTVGNTLSPWLSFLLTRLSFLFSSGKKRKKTRGDHFKQRFRKNFQALLEEENLSMSEGPNYLTACAPPSKFPQRHFCAVCGFPSSYTCVSCGARYCCVRCLGTHHETRCLKWTV
ncbi:zinc finger HIT domain-containing protein 1 isoform X1 [Megalops cyprinoides]|uniref:zinc finger HIT domain-containing protein 1 isoform X1 n=1 Tax=Megalops cyprinoides TaxID=118141 RepID=UPI0018645D1F|nr:zinc finger HIT domain-containing protein 1 isoform X1 [Megalops cyprinoides]